MIVVSLLYLCSFCCDTRWVSGKGRRQKEAFSAFLLFPSLVSEISTNQTLMRLLTANEVTANTHTHTHTLPHVHFHLFNYKKKPNKPLFPSVLWTHRPWVWTRRPCTFTHTHTHSADHDEWSPQGGVDKRDHFLLLFFFLWPVTLTHSFPSLRPLSHSRFVSYIFIDALPSCFESLLHLSP